jgi:PfaD family protein
MGPSFSKPEIASLVQRPRLSLTVVRDPASGALGVAAPGVPTPPFERVTALPGLSPTLLGDPAFLCDHQVGVGIVGGAMAAGIGSVRLVLALARAGLLGIFGAAGLPVDVVERSIQTLHEEAGGRPFGANLIHSPQEPALETRIADLYVERGVPVVEASAFLGLTPALVHVACAGLHARPDGRIVRARRVIGKVSRPEVAARFLSPPPMQMLDRLVAEGRLTTAEARLATRMALVGDLTVEGDSAGHTDRRPLGALFPVVAALRDRLADEHGLAEAPRLGAAGGLGTPAAVASAFALGAAYVVLGSVNQAAVESGMSDAGRQLLAEAELADVAMAPAADMFEIGAEVQVLLRGTLFAPRAQRLAAAWRTHRSIDALPADVREELEQKVLGASFDEVWQQTRAFWSAREPGEVARAEDDPRHRFALCCRWYLGMSSRWARQADVARRLDWQIWCGPAMGAFNDWTRGTFLADPSQRTAVQIALNLVEGAAVWTRAHQLRTFGVPVPPWGFDFSPRPLSEPVPASHRP